MSPGDLRFGVIIAAGPGDVVALRVADTVASLERTLPRISQVLIIDDDPASRRTFSAASTLCCLAAPRNGEGDGWKGGLACSMLSTFSLLDTDVDWWLKCDDDSCAVTPLDTSNLPDPAIPALIGVADWLYPNTPRDLGPIDRYIAAVATGTTIAAAAVAPLAAFKPGLRFRRSVVELVAACRDRRPLARHAHGGGYLFSRGALAAARSAGVLDTAEDWLAGDIGEDVAIGLCFRASGVKVIDATTTSVRLAIQRECLPAKPAVLRSDGIWLTHSTKSRGWADELRLRNELQGHNDFRG